jgi:hypothetical protein
MSIQGMNQVESYWHKRYLQALAKLGAAQSLQTRAAYRDLAAHYDAMRHFCERHTLGTDLRSAA